MIGLVTLASLVVVGLVLTSLAGAVVFAAPTVVAPSGGAVHASAGSLPSGTHGACVVAAIRAAHANGITGFGSMISSMARRC